MGAREDLALLGTSKLRSEYRANAVRAAVLAEKPRSGPLTAERNGLTLIFDADPILIRDRAGNVVGTDAMVRAFRGGNEVRIDPHRVCINPPLLVPDGTFTEVEETHPLKGTRKTLRPNYREDPWAAYLDWLFDSIEKHPNPKGWRTRGTVSTFYANTDDGQLYSQHATFSTAADGSGVGVGTEVWVGVFRTGGFDWVPQAAYFRWDTSAIADTDTIDAATCSFYGQDGAAGIDEDLVVWMYTWSGSGLTTADWRTSAQLQALTEVARYAETNSWSTSGYNDFTESASAFRSNINVTGYTEVVVSSASHESGSAPSYSAGDHRIYDADTAGTTNDPKLVVTHSASGVTGTAAPTLQKATASLSGTQSYIGTITATLTKAIASLTGTHEQTGTIAATLQYALATLAGVAADGVSGSIISTLQPVTATLAGEIAQIGTIAATLQMATASLSGVMHPDGTIVATLQKATASLTGEQAQLGTISVTLQPATASLAGTQSYVGTIAATLLPALGSLVGVQLQSGVIVATLQPALANLAGTQLTPVTGTITTTLQYARASLSGLASTIDYVVLYELNLDLPSYNSVLEIPKYELNSPLSIPSEIRRVTW